MMPECTFTVHADCRVRIIPLIGGILKTPSLYRIDFFIILNMNLFLQTKHYSSLALALISMCILGISSERVC
jgi:hypothetical protein